MQKQLKMENLTPDQRAYFNSLTEKQQKYVLFRAQGLNRKDAYESAGYKGNNMAQNAYHMETRDNPRIKEIIDAFMGIVPIVPAEKMRESIDTKTAELVESTPPIVDEGAKDAQWNIVMIERAKNLAFYRDVADGKIKTVKKTKKYDADGKLIGTTIEEVDDVETRIKAQKEVMRLQGASEILEIGKVQAQSINVMIVDASKKESPPSEIGEIKTGEVDGKTVIVEESEEREVAKKTKRGKQQRAVR